MSTFACHSGQVRPIPVPSKAPIGVLSIPVVEYNAANLVPVAS